MNISDQPLLCARPNASFLDERQKRGCLLAQPQGIESEAAQTVLVRLGQRILNSLPVVDQLLGEFKLSPEEEEQIKVGAVSEMERQLPRLMKIATLTALLPIIRQRAEGQFYRRGIRPADLKDLGQTLVFKILQALYGAWPKGNFGAWVTTIQENVACDYGRQAKRANKLGRRHDGDVLNQLASTGMPESESEAREEALAEFVDRLPEVVRHIVDRRQANESWTSIANDLGISPAQARRTVQRIEWPDGSSPRPVI